MRSSGASCQVTSGTNDQLESGEQDTGDCSGRGRLGGGGDGGLQVERRTKKGRGMEKK